MDATAQNARYADTPFVPTGALGVAAAALALLLAALLSSNVWALNFVHVSAGALWTAIDLFMGFVIGPILARSEVPVRVAITKRLMPQMLVIMPTVVLITVVAGWQLASQIGVLTMPYPQRWWVVSSYVVVATMAMLAYTVLEPANITVLIELRKARPDGGLIDRMMRRFARAAGIIGLLQLAILVIMTRLRFP
jgi:hypothetical protein